MTKYTPGPWTANGTKIIANSQIVDDERTQLVADLMPGTGQSLTITQENARLIAAAPEMAEALLLADGMCAVIVAPDESPRKEIRAALQKAGLL